MRDVRAVIFDLYGTLVRIRRPLVHRGVPRRLGVGAGPWMQLVREHLLVSPFEDVTAVAETIRDRIAPDADAEAVAECARLFADEVASVEVFEGALPLLHFLSRRGIALGLLSNLTSPHKEPVERLGLAAPFAAMSFSCDEGKRKPDPALFLGLCERLEVAPEDTVMVGDSRRSDIQPAAELGIRTALVSSRGEPGSVSAVSELGWTALGLGDSTRPLIDDSSPVRLGRSRVYLTGLAAISDAEQGRYNLVATAFPRGADGQVDDEPVFCKRFLFPEAAYVEEFSRELLSMVDLPCGRATVIGALEPVLVTTRAPGSKIPSDDSLRHDMEPDLAFELGRQCAAGYVFANADLRPRNTFLDYQDGRPIVTMLDLEHMLFNLALDTTGLDRPLLPQTFDRLSEDEIARRLRRRVLTERTTRRAMRSFIEPDSAESELGRAFRRGWVQTYRNLQAASDRICDRIEERIYTPPYLIVGTRAHRRAFARVDMEEIRARIAEDPEELYPKLAAFRRPR